jgi:hypothetical protein
MRVVKKYPQQLPEVYEIGDDFTDLQKAVGGLFEQCLQDKIDDAPRTIVWCDEEGLYKRDAKVNIVRPTDGQPIVGPVVVTGTETKTHGHGEWNASLTDEEADLWVYLLTAFGYAIPGRVMLLRELWAKLTPRCQRHVEVVSKLWRFRVIDETSGISTIAVIGKDLSS